MTSHPITFGTDGWRAIVGEAFNFDNVARVTRAIGHHMLREFSTKRPVVIGYDTRNMGSEFAHHAAKVLSEAGFSVLIVGQYTPTPVVAHAALAYESCGALMFTASHNPAEYCGIKFIPHYAGPATNEITNGLLTLIDQDAPLPSGKGSIETFSPFERYVDFLSETIDFDVLKSHPLKILYDPMYGAGQGYLDAIFSKKAGLKIDMIHNKLDPSFGGHLPEPKPEYLDELLAGVPAGKYDLGIANDGDADRFGLVDETGRYLATNRLIPMLYWYLYHRKGYRGSVVRTTATSTLLDHLAKKYGAKLYETPVGFKYVGEWMRREDVVIGGEESGGVSVLGHIPEKDGILGSLLAAEMMAHEKKSLSQLYEDLVQEAGIRLHQESLNFHLTEAGKQDVLKRLGALTSGDTFGGVKIERLDKQDGVKLVFGESRWMLVRPSGTEPIVRLYAESPDEAEVENLCKAAGQFMEADCHVH